ncbi:MAG: glycosyltransferase [Actinobacteria bacterium]|nr:glycosyltransferase [Actinomycetota bacterium]
MKILFALESYPPTINGSGIATMRLTTGLAKRGNQVTVICPGKNRNYKYSIEEGVFVHRIDSFPVILHKEYRFSPFAGRQVKKIFNDFNPDIIHVADHLFVAKAAIRQAKKKNIKIVGTNHFTPYNWLSNLKIKDNTVLYRIVERILWNLFLNVFNGIDAVITPTETAKSIVEEVGLKKKVTAISNGLDLCNYKKNKAGDGIYDKYKISKQKTILLSVSRLDKEKRVSVLLEAVNTIKDKVDFQFVITGRGKDKENLEKIVIEKNLSGRIIFTDFIINDELKKLYGISDIFLSASEVELQGLSIMEAMASGLPVVASRSMAIPELVKDGINGYLFEPGNADEAGDKILHLAADKELREKMAQESLFIIREHDIEKTLDKHEEIYRECLLS